MMIYEMVIAFEVSWKMQEIHTRFIGCSTVSTFRCFVRVQKKERGNAWNSNIILLTQKMGKHNTYSHQKKISAIVTGSLKAAELLRECQGGTHQQQTSTTTKTKSTGTV
jgi:hypothetical protein